MKETQHKVDQWIQEHGVRYFNELTNFTLLTEEVGELARYMSRVYGEQSFKKGEEQHLVKQKIEEVEERDHLKNWQPPIDGESIMKIFNIRPGKEVGILKNAIKEAILEGAIKNEYTDAFDFMVKKGIEIGLIPLAEHERK